VQQSCWPAARCTIVCIPAVPARLEAVCLPALSGAWMCCRAYDWKSGNRFQQYTSPIQPGSLESESGIFALTFDK
jgi:hypothetical protein